MSPPLSAAQLVALLERWGLRWHAYASDWRTHNRDVVGAFGPVHGIAVHDFASNIADVSSAAYAYRGDKARAMPGPLYQVGAEDDGDLVLLGWGRATHAAGGDPAVTSRVRAGTMPLDREMTPRMAGANGDTTTNDWLYSICGFYGGKPTAKQRASMVRYVAAICSAHGWDAGSVVGHCELTTNRSDPEFDMGGFRRDVQAAIKAGPAPPPPPPPPTEEDPLAGITLDQIGDEVEKRLAAVFASPRVTAVGGTQAGEKVSRDFLVVNAHARAVANAEVLARMLDVVEKLAAGQKVGIGTLTALRDEVEKLAEDVADDGPPATK